MGIFKLIFPEINNDGYYTVYGPAMTLSTQYF